MGTRRAGHPFLCIPGPTPVPARILRAMHRPPIDHRGPAFRELARRVLDGLRRIFRCRGPVVIYPASGTGGWEAALANTLERGDRVLFCESGHFAGRWRQLAGRLGLDPLAVEFDWREGVDPERIGGWLRRDRERRIRAVCLIHNETSTGVVNPVRPLREMLDALDHDALLMVDTISSLASLPYGHDEDGADVTVGASQKGLMLPPGLSFNAIGERALERHRRLAARPGYFDWSGMLAANADGLFPYTPATGLLFGLEEAITMLEEEGLEEVWRRHARLGRATRSAVAAWGLEPFCRDSQRYSDSLTAVMVPEKFDAERLRGHILERFDLSLGNGLGPLRGRVFRVGHLGDINDLMLLGALAGIEMGLWEFGLEPRESGVSAAMRQLRDGGGEGADASGKA